MIVALYLIAHLICALLACYLLILDWSYQFDTSSNDLIVVGTFCIIMGPASLIASLFITWFRLWGKYVPNKIIMKKRK